MYQKLQIIGHVGRDPEMRYTPSGQPVTSFSVATNRKWTGNDGQPKEETTWFKVSAWGKLAETCNQYVTKGLLIMCEGRLSSQINIWTDQTGAARAGYDLTADTVKFLGGGRGNEGGGEGESHQQPTNYAPAAPRQPNQAAPRNQPPAPRPAVASAPPPRSDYGPDDGGIDEGEIPF
jgi:single-strand DNA-binding protein